MIPPRAQTLAATKESGSGEGVPDTEEGLRGPSLGVVPRKSVSDSALPEGSC